jgi:hypothetical protein
LIASPQDKRLPQDALMLDFLFGQQKVTRSHPIFFSAIPASPARTAKNTCRQIWLIILEANSSLVTSPSRDLFSLQG